MSETRSDAPPGGESNAPDAANAAEVQALSALNGHAAPTDDTPTIISRAGPHSRHEEPPGGLRGRKLAHFELIEPIGVGGMAAVIRARDTQLDRLVALKILPPDMAKDEENVRRFHQEARSAARLDHENIARVFFCGEDQGLHFIAFEFVEGDNLRTVLERRGRLPVAEALHYVLQVAAGLAHAAQRGVVHRDIKPSNIIITPTGRAKLVDMGLARSLERQDDQGLTQSGVTLGTFDYISPEQALEPREADVRSDIYSLGCTLYHVLTGRPPVPEGTAAKKLHHHQHIKPRDPREVVPGLPDETVVILDRMMAKRPQDRYQSPELLVHHLLAARNKIGGPSNIPEGVLSVEAALPQPPGGRPMLLAALAAGIVVLLILALQLFNRPPAAGAGAPLAVVPPTSPRPDAGPGPVNPANNGSKPSDDGQANPPAPPQAPGVAHYDGDGHDLADFLRTADHNAPKEIVLSGDVVLRLPEPPQNGDAGLVVAGPRVTIRAKSGRRPTIRFTHNGDPQGPNPWVGVSIDSPNVTISGFRFLVDGRAADDRMAALRLHAPPGAPSTFTVDNCEFIQARAGTGEKRLASLDAASDGAAATLTLSGCRFLSFQRMEYELLDSEALVNEGPFGGDDAVLREGPVQIQAVNCAFGPHGAAFRLEGGKDVATAPALTLNHCSVLAAGPSVVFDVARDAAVELSAEASLFARADAAPSAAGPFVLVRQADGRGVSFADRDNRYYGLDAFRVIGDDRQQWTAFENWAGAEPQTSAVLMDSPWKAADPLQPLRRYSLKDDREDRFAAAFQVKESRAARPDLRLAADRALPVGVETLGGVDYVKALRDADKAADVLLKKQRIVDPKKDDSANRVYRTLEQALEAADAGDEILLRWDGVQPVAPIRLEKKAPQDVTIRPDENRHPQVLLTAGQDAEPALFRVYDGRLRLEGLELILRPQEEYRRQALIELVGQGQCGLKNCLVTLDRNGQTNTRLAVVWLSDPSKAMMQPTRPSDQPAQLTLDGCFVRGDGDLVACPMSRPLALDANNVLAALKGSFLCVDGGSPSAPATADQMTLTMKKVTAYLGGNLVRLRTKDSVTPVHCAATDCLFVGAAKEPLVQVNESDLSQVLEDRDLGRLLTWTGGGRIEYANYDTMLEQTPPAEEMAPMPIGAARWETVWGNNTGDKQIKPFRWVVPPPTADERFDLSSPSQFRPLDAADSCGADVDALERRLPPALPK